MDKIATKRPYRDVRIWQTCLEVTHPLPGVPTPELVVEEQQDHPSYRCNGLTRKMDTGSQVVCTVAGCGGLCVNGQTHKLGFGDVFVHNHNDPEVCYFYPADGHGAWRFLWLAFENAEATVAAFNRRYGYRFHLPPENSLVALLTSFRSRGAYGARSLTPLAGGRLIFDILDNLSNAQEQTLQTQSGSVLVGRARELLLGALNSPTAIADTARQLEISREHLSRLFRKVSGGTVHDYLMQTKLELALALLRQRRLSCKEAAAAAGFRQYSTFSRAVRRQTGKSPEEFRNARETDQD